MAFPWAAALKAGKVGAPAMGVGAAGLYGYGATNSEIDTEKVRGSGISMGLAAGATGAVMGAWYGSKAIWKTLPKKPAPLDIAGNRPTNFVRPNRNPNTGSMTGESWNRAKASAGNDAFFENGIMNENMYPKARPGYRPRNLPMKVTPKRGSLGLGKRIGGTLGFIGAAAGLAYAATSMITYKDNASNLAANISQSNASSSGFDPGEGGSYTQSENQRFIQSTEGLVQGLHRNRH